MTSKSIITVLGLAVLTLGACKKEDKVTPTTPTGGGKDPSQAEKVSVDRFSKVAGTLMVRDANNGLPGPNEPINFDEGPFITMGLGPDGSMVEYYNFDVQSTSPAPIYVLMYNGEPIKGQLNVIDVIPGDEGYNDFWQVNMVEVPENYVANTITSYQEIKDKGYTIVPTTKIVNCPVVPEGSVATKRHGNGATGLTMGWYKGKVVHYFNFVEKDLSTIGNGNIPTSPIYVTFKINPDMPGGGPSSGFVTEMGTMQTHNVVATVPQDAGYSPLWSVNVYDNADFSSVLDLPSAQAANVLATGVALVNCPIVSD